MIRALMALYVTHATIVAYMLQSTEYEIGPYLKWYWRTQNFATVMQRRVLDRTRRANLLLFALRCGMALQGITGITLITFGSMSEYREAIAFGLALLLSYPIIWAHLIVVPLLVAKYMVVLPRHRQQIQEAETLFANSSALRIAVLGSYGKTTMKEILAAVLREGKNVVATPANKNVAISHAKFIKELPEDVDVMVLEYGEGAPGDIERFARMTHPTHAVVTGIAPAHLDAYKTLDAVAEDLFSISKYVEGKRLYINRDAILNQSYARPDYLLYGADGIGKWRAGDIEVALSGTQFVLQNGIKKLVIKSGLLGRHQIGPLSAAAVLALDLGMTTSQVANGVANTAPFAHRMQPYQLGGAWVIDDTYNGNLEGIRAGTALLQELSATRKWYVTPGLVDQGSDTARIHEEVGQLIAAAEPDVVVLMKNSVTQFIQKGLEKAQYTGEVRIEPVPLDFYTNLEHFLTKGDLVLMQNDWTDNYA